MNFRLMTVEEHAALQQLEANGPSRTLHPKVRGRLALYRMIDEGPRGWAITEAGRKMLHTGCVAPLSSEQLLFSLAPVLATAQNMAWLDGEECLVTGSSETLPAQLGAD